MFPAETADYSKANGDCTLYFPIIKSQPEVTFTAHFCGSYIFEFNQLYAWKYSEKNVTTQNYS